MPIARISLDCSASSPNKATHTHTRSLSLPLTKMALTVRASATTRPSSRNSVPFLQTKTVSISKNGVVSKSHSSSSSSSSSSFPISSTTLSIFALFTGGRLQARALTLPKEDIVSSLTQVEKTVDQVSEVSSNVFDTAKSIFETVTKTLKPGVDAAVPILKQAGEEALKIASPAVSEATKKAQEAMQSSGFDMEPALTAAKTVADAAQQTTKVIEVAKPVASSTVEMITTADPQTIVVAGGALLLTYLLLPPIVSAISFTFRGYKDDLTPAQALDLISTKNYLMIDIRSEKDKDKAGIPRLPSSAKNRMISIPLEELPSKLKGLVRNPKKAEAEIAALKISYLKKINKGSNIVILDSYSDSAKIVARTLTSLGFKNCYIVADGFSGGRGWLQSRLGIDSYNFSFAEVISPSQVISQRFGASSSKKLITGGSN